jgi:hypothetical protein
MSKALGEKEPLQESEPLVICDKNHHPSGHYGCFRCIDEELLGMVDKNKVKVFSVPVFRPTPTMKLSESDLTSSEGDEANRLDSKEFFNFLHDNNVCFKIFFTKSAFIKEYGVVKILETIPSVVKEDGSKQAVAGKQSVVGEQPNFLQKFTTYYEYEYETTDGSRQSSCAFMLEFTDNVQILRGGVNPPIFTKRIYIILNKFCNNKITEGQIISEKFHHDITHALNVLNSHLYEHSDIDLGNLVDCGESSIPQYMAIDFGRMKKTSRISTYDIHRIDSIIEKAQTPLLTLEDKGGGQTRYKLKRSRSRCRKIRTKSKSKSNNKHRTRTKSKSKNKRETIRK